MQIHSFFCYTVIFLSLTSVWAPRITGETKEVPVTVTILPNQGMHPVPSDFPGFSYEISQLTDTSCYLHPDNSVLIRMIRNLGDGVIRIGGNSSDKTGWTGKARTNFTGKDSLTTTDIAVFSAFARKTGWKVLFGLNLGANNPEINASEAVYVAGELKNALYAFQIGNEPDLYYKHLRPQEYNETAFEKEWLANYLKLKSKLPDIPVAGPAIAGDIRWFESFTKKYPDKLLLLTAHYYNSPGKNPAVSWHTLLEPDNHLSAYLQTLNTLCNKYGLSYRMAECNSVSRGGKSGVSNTFASALWGLDYMWTVALNNGKGVNFHGGSVSKYAPIVLDGKGTTAARPLYYAMLAFHYGSKGGTIVPAVISPSVPNSSAYACINNDTLKVTLLNKSEDPLIFTVRLPYTPASVGILRLTAPGPTAESDVRFAGKEVEADGNFRYQTEENIQPENKQFQLSVPAMSAAVAVINKM